MRDSQFLAEHLKQYSSSMISKQSLSFTKTTETGGRVKRALDLKSENQSPDPSSDVKAL